MSSLAQRLHEERKARLIRLGAITARANAPMIEAPITEAEPAPEPKVWPWFRMVDAPLNPSILEIQIEVAKFYRVSVNDLVSPRRDTPVTTARQIACYLCKELTLFSLPVIGKKFGGRDHTTILHAVRKVKGLIRSDAEIAHEVATLFELVTGVQQ